VRWCFICPVWTFLAHLFTIAISNQLLHAMVRSYERKLPTVGSFWDLLWTAMRLHISLPRLRRTSPVLIIRAFNVVGTYGRQYSNADMVKCPRYRQFVGVFSYLLPSHLPYTTTDHGKRVAASILFHPVWNELASTARALPQTADLYELRSYLDILDGLKHKHALHNYAPLSFDWTRRLYSKPKLTQPHISVDIHSVARVDDTRPSVPVDRCATFAPAWVAPPGGVERDAEMVVGFGDDAVLNTGMLSSSDPLLIPPNGFTRAGHPTTNRTASSVLVSVPSHTKAGEDLDAELGDARLALHEAAAADGGSLVDRRLPSRMGDGKP